MYEKTIRDLLKALVIESKFDAQEAIDKLIHLINHESIEEEEQELFRWILKSYFDEE